MQARTADRAVNQAVAAVQALDLEPIRLRVMDAERGEGWTKEHAESVERAYRTYLTMLVRYPEAMESIVVSEDVDEFWHTHILHTVKYTADCQRVFGAYLHHNPQLEARSPADIERTRHLYRDLTAGAAEGAMCSAAVQAGAMCSAAVEAAAMCSAAIRADKGAMCSAAVHAEDAAMCSAAIRADKPAMCSAAIQAAAMCSAAVQAKEAAMCSAAVHANDAAMCSAAIGADKAAMCSAAIQSAAMCSAAVHAN